MSISFRNGPARRGGVYCTLGAVAGSSVQYSLIGAAYGGFISVQFGLSIRISLFSLLSAFTNICTYCVPHPTQNFHFYSTVQGDGFTLITVALLGEWLTIQGLLKHQCQLQEARS